MPHENDPSQNESTPAVNTTEKPVDVNAIVNAAITHHLKRFAEKQLPELIASAMNPALEKLATTVQAPAKTEEPQASNKPDPQVAALNAKLEELTKRLSDTEAQRLATEKKAREDRAFNELKTSLAGQVRPEYLDMLANNLFHIEKVVEFNDDGSVVFKGHQEKIPGYKEEVLFPLKDGVSQWLKSDAAKAFLPAPAPSTAPNVSRRPTASPSKFEPGVDVSKLSDEGKLAYADQREQELAALIAKASGR